MKLLAITSVAVVAMAGLFASSAGADPSNAAKSTSIIVVCGSVTTSIVANGNGIFAPAHDVANTSTLVPVALDTTITFTFTAGGPPSVDHAIVGKDKPLQDPVSCQIPLQTLFTTPDVSATIQGTITGFWTPR